jgi:uroporphyrinogen decarboxylase
MGGRTHNRNISSIRLGKAMESLSSRERVRRALNHEETDRPPADLGSTCNTSITKIAYRNLRKYLGFSSSYEPVYLSGEMQVVQPEESILERLHIDTRGVHAHPPDIDNSRKISEDVFTDEWGIQYRAAWRNGEVLYYDIEKSPLSHEITLKDIEHHRWPDPHDPGRTRGLREQALAFRRSTEYALVGHMGDTSLFQACTMIRGMEEFLMDLIVNRKIAQALLEKVLDIQAVKMEKYLEAVGEYLDVVSIGEDYGGQTGPLISPDLFRQLVKPYLKSYFDIVKQKSPAKLHLHSCGAIEELLGDFIDIGVDIINPVQVSARGMDPVILKRRYGKRLSFWGGIDTQRMLPRGSPREVELEVRRIIDILGKDGGYVLNPVHNIQPDVPPQNVVALFDAIV